jgi:hypothetical protein
MVSNSIFYNYTYIIKYGNCIVLDIIRADLVISFSQKLKKKIDFVQKKFSPVQNVYS